MLVLYLHIKLWCISFRLVHSSWQICIQFELHHWFEPFWITSLSCQLCVHIDFSQVTTVWISRSNIYCFYDFRTSLYLLHPIKSQSVYAAPIQDPTYESTAPKDAHIMHVALIWSPLQTLNNQAIPTPRKAVTMPWFTHVLTVPHNPPVWRFYLSPLMVWIKPSKWIRAGMTLLITLE